MGDANGLASRQPLHLTLGALGEAFRREDGDRRVRVTRSIDEIRERLFAGGAVECEAVHSAFLEQRPRFVPRVRRVNDQLRIVEHQLQRVPRHVVATDDHEAGVRPGAPLGDGVEDDSQRVLGVHGLGQHADGAQCVGAFAVFFRRDDEHGNVPRRQIVLQAVEHMPAVDVGQTDVEGNRVGLPLAGHGDGGGAERRGQRFVTTLASEVEQDAGEPQIVVDHEHDTIAGLDAVAIVVADRYRLGNRERCHRRRRRRLDSRPAPGAAAQPDVCLRQIQGERAAVARAALEHELAAEQPGELAADRETEAGAAVLAAGAAVGLLERLEDDLLLVRRDADAGVATPRRP